MSLALGKLRASYNRSELLKTLRGHFEKLQDADNQKQLQVGGSHYDIRIKDRASQEDIVSLDLPGMTRNVKVDARLEPGPWRSGFLSVTRVEGGEINIKKAEFPNSFSPFRSITVDELRIAPGRMDEPHFISIELGHGEQARKFTTDLCPEDHNYPHATVQSMLKQAESLMPNGKLAFYQPPVGVDEKPAGWSGRSPL